MSPPKSFGWKLMASPQNLHCPRPPPQPINYERSLRPQAAQAQFVWVRASQVILSEYTRIISVLSCQINAQILKIWSFLVCLSVLAFKITKVDISCIITGDSGPYCSNFITCIRIYDAKKNNHNHAKYWFKKPVSVCDRARVTTLPRESDVLSIWRGRQAPRCESRRITARLRIMATRSWPELMRNAALLGLMQPNLETGARRTGRYTLFSLAGGNFREIACFVWNVLAFVQRRSVGRSPAFSSFIVFSTRWKGSRLNGV